MTNLPNSPIASMQCLNNGQIEIITKSGSLSRIPLAHAIDFRTAQINNSAGLVLVFLDAEQRPLMAALVENGEAFAGHIAQALRPVDQKLS